MSDTEYALNTFTEADGNMTFDEGMELKIMMDEYAMLGSLNPFTGESFTKLYDIREEYNTAMEQINILELAQLSYGEVAIYEAMADGSSLWSKFISAAKSFFAKMLEALTMIWNWASRMLDKYVSANALFVSKYEKMLKGVDTVKFANGYKFGDIVPPTVYKISVPDNIDKSKTLSDDEIRIKKDDIITAISNGKINGSVSNPAQEFHQLYYGNLYPDPGTAYDIKKQLEFIKSCKSDQKNITVPFKKAVMEMKVLALALSKFVSMQNFVTHPVEDSKYIMQYVELCKYNVEVLYAAYTQYVKAVIDRTNQARAICIKALQDKINGNMSSTQGPAATTEAVFVTSRKSLAKMHIDA